MTSQVSALPATGAPLRSSPVAGNGTSQEEGEGEAFEE
jgi:hypothetical protein